MQPQHGAIAGTQGNLTQPIMNTKDYHLNGCLQLTPMDFLRVLSGITPASLYHENWTLNLVNKALNDPGHLLNNIVQVSTCVTNAFPLPTTSPAILLHWKAPTQASLTPGNLAGNRQPDPPNSQLPLTISYHQVHNYWSGYWWLWIQSTPEWVGLMLAFTDEACIQQQHAHMEQLSRLHSTLWRSVPPWALPKKKTLT